MNEKKLEGMELVQKERIIVLQTLAEVYLKTKGLPPSAVMFNTADEFGELTNQQVMLLHYYLMNEYSKMGMDLIACIKRTGEEIVPGKLSQYEIKELISRADDMIYFLGVLAQRKDALINK